MDILYKVGIVVGIIVVYAFATLGLAAVITFSQDGPSDATGFFGWLIGLVAFVVLAVFTLEKFGLWRG